MKMTVLHPGAMVVVVVQVEILYAKSFKMCTGAAPRHPINNRLLLPKLD